MTKKIFLIGGARPNFMKIAPLYHALQAHGDFEPSIIHTGQHHDYALSAGFFKDLGLPEPAINFGVGSGSHGEQTAKILVACENYLMDNRPNLVVVPGDVNSTLACALAAAKLGVPVAHLEAGLRSFDNTMPEEINRALTDRLADILWTPSADADENLKSEGVTADKISRVGNIMIDSLVRLLPKIDREEPWTAYNLSPQGYAVITLHRPHNVDNTARLKEITGLLDKVTDRIPMVLPLHPRTEKRLKESGLLDDVKQIDNLHLSPPLGYIRFMALLKNAKAVLTDSGGLQEETSWLQIPCLTLRPNTERPVTVTMGTNELVSLETAAEKFAAVLEGSFKQGQSIPLWDGKTAGRIVTDLEKRLT